MHFESHYTKLQADSNYLLSEEYEVRLDNIHCPLGNLDHTLEYISRKSEYSNLLYFNKENNTDVCRCIMLL